MPTPYSKARKAVFLDRDGVINHNLNNYVRSIDDIRIIPRSLQAIANLTKSEYAIVIVTNQSAIGRRLITPEIAQQINEFILNKIQSAKGVIDGIYVCPHHPKTHCNCRKPKPGLLIQAATELNLDLEKSWLIGDAITDIQAAIAVKANPILVATGRGADQANTLDNNKLAHIPFEKDLYDAAKYILGHT
ncbi:MAG TPA: D-glycero-beta-D-manno-heptose-1,7-bisphosphate 7-phosphatase [Chloroflexi bacterium]|nr:D-glycero-beta-D-manno-heptose-1,7-bisphosphate 7-phosphatase [Chloroflexota bacterium]